MVTCLLKDVLMRTTGPGLRVVAAQRSLQLPLLIPYTHPVAVIPRIAMALQGNATVIDRI